MGYSIATVKTNLSYTLLAAFLVSVTILPLRVHSTIIFQDNFNLEPGGTSFTSITNWNATAGNFDVIGDGFFDIYPGNGKYIDMAGSTNATIETSTSILLNPGTHQLTFNLGTNLADNSINFSVEDLTFETTLFFENIDAPADGSPPMSTIVRDFEVTASTSAQIIFEEVGL